MKFLNQKSILGVNSILLIPALIISTGCSTREGEWKLIYYHENQSFELFNLTEDIGKTTNPAEKEPEKLREMAGLLANYLRKVEAQMPVYKETGESVKYPNHALPFIK